MLEERMSSSLRRGVEFAGNAFPSDDHHFAWLLHRPRQVDANQVEGTGF